MKDKIIDRLKAHVTSPDIYEPPTFKQLLTLFEELENDLGKIIALLESGKD